MTKQKDVIENSGSLLCSSCHEMKHYIKLREKYVVDAVLDGLLKWMADCNPIKLRVVG